LENTEENCEMIGKIWKKRRLYSEKIWKIQKKIVKRYEIKVITKLPNSEQSYKGIVQTHNYITALTNILPILFLYLNTVTVTTGTFEP
jgi:hypothetical protein